MPRLVISTVGTSLLTQRIDNKKPEETTWFKLLSNHANLKMSETPDDIRAIILELKNRAVDKLAQAKVADIRRASAELNGIYGLYEEQLNQAQQDFHWLIATDTAQGQETANTVQYFLEKAGINAQVYTPKGLSAANTEGFSNGIDDLLEWIDDLIPGYKEQGYKIYFNLVGGFKSLQAYLNTIGMFYADEIIYIFEGQQSDLIKIPRLPITIDYEIINPVQFALMAAGNFVEMSQLEQVPEALLFKVEDEASLSNWGRLIWNNCKERFLTKDLLSFPKIHYEESFKRDYERNNVNAEMKLELQEKLAIISGTLVKYKGDLSRLDPKLKYRRYEGGKVKHIDHFYVNNDKAWRASCILQNGELYMRHFGEHDYVNDNP